MTAAAPVMRVVAMGARTSPPRSLWTDAWLRLRRNRMAVVGIGTVIVVAVIAVLAPLVAPYSMNDQYHEKVYYGPVWDTGDWAFILGTDAVGRDELSRLIWGARISLIVGFVPVMIRLILGGLIGITSGYLGGRVDNILMRIADVFYAIPDILFAIIMSAAFRDTWFGQQMGGLLLLFSSLALFGWEGLARLVRGQVLSLKEKEFVEAARALGATPTRIMWRHIVPNTLAPVIVSLAFGIPSAIIGEAGLSFIGLGVRPPTASWGNMLQDGLSSIYSQPTLIAAPAACIAVILLAFTFLGDGLRDALDPRMKQ